MILRERKLPEEKNKLLHIFNNLGEHLITTEDVVYLYCEAIDVVLKLYRIDDKVWALYNSEVAVPNTPGNEDAYINMTFYPRLDALHIPYAYKYIDNQAYFEMLDVYSDWFS